MTQWDARTMRYRDAAGRFVNRSAVVAARDEIVRAVERQITTLTMQLRDRSITLAQWQAAIKDNLRAGHTLAAGIAGGGKKNMSKADWGRVGAQVREQYKYLNRFARQIETGAPVNLGRARMYAKAIRNTFLNFERIKKQEAGYTTAIWHRTAKESCAGCIEATGSWAIEECPAIGSHECLSNCLCFLTYE